MDLLSPYSANSRVLAVLAFLSFAPYALCARDFDIRDYGARVDGKTLNTFAIQKAIDECAAVGGGRVLVDGGTYLTGTVCLKSGVELHIEANAVLMGSPDWQDWKDQPDARHIDTYFCPRHRSAAHTMFFPGSTEPNEIHIARLAYVEP